MDTVVLERFEFSWQAHIAKGRLQAEGISAIVLNEHHCSAHWIIVNALGLIELHVPKSDATTARAILRRHHAGENELSSHYSGSEKVICANCGGTSREKLRNLWTKEFWVYVTSFALFGIFWPSKCWIEYCRRCQSAATS